VKPRASVTPLRIALLSVLALLLAALVWQWQARPGPLTLSGESTSDTPAFSLASGRYALSADLLPGCQYTFYLTPAGQLWNRAGTAIASASGERTLRVQTDPRPAGQYFVHGFTAPEEGCSWTLHLRPL